MPHALPTPNTRVRATRADIELSFAQFFAFTFATTLVVLAIAHNPVGVAQFGQELTLLVTSLFT